MSDKLIDACLTGINIAAKYEELFGMYQDQDAELTKLKSDVARLRTSAEIAEGIIDRIASIQGAYQTPEFRTLVGDSVNWKRCHAPSSQKTTNG